MTVGPIWRWAKVFACARLSACLGGERGERATRSRACC
jgi:hypothetical protein